jgi:transposase
MVEAKDTDARRAVVALIGRGLLSPNEAMKLAGVSRQLIYYWVKAADINWRRVRSAKLAKLWAAEINRR